ncbi:hypothetical protein BN2476_100017 [Paraburkholderia piptadeniae]|uniref:Uncharacterized protein n=1 Tax=Paraburkholderia piptadeniae TaxID=1701573 RepID=A0A1N7RNG0_9BURK|nr:hypothetical protein BN2476_100017 [Paraburkholderia piptadeniae]
MLLAESYEIIAVTATNTASGKINHNSNRARKLSVNLNSLFHSSTPTADSPHASRLWRDSMMLNPSYYFHCRSIHVRDFHYHECSPRE